MESEGVGTGEAKSSRQRSDEIVVVVVVVVVKGMETDNDCENHPVAHPQKKKGGGR